MFKNYLQVALRNLRKRRVYALINIFGLGLGIAASLLILLFARHELSYDQFHERADDVYLVYKERLTPAGTQITRDTWPPLSEALLADYPSVRAGVRLWSGTLWVAHGETRFEEMVTYTDPSLFDVFTFPLAQGDPATALAEPTGLVLSEAMARKYFGDADPLGQPFTINHNQHHIVTGVLAPIPSNSTVEIDLAVSFLSDPRYADFAEDWGGSFLFTYLLLDDGADPAALEAQFPDFIARTWDAEVAARTHFRLEPLPALYDALNGNRQYAYILLIIGVMILLIGAINFMNLSTARSLERAREVGMRKALGAGRGQLAGQFLGEAIVTSLLGLVLGVSLAELALPFFNDLYGLDLRLDYFGDIRTIPILLGLGVGVGLLAGSYPAFVLSGFGLLKALQGRLHRDRRSLGMRQGLVITQFALAMVLMVGTLVVYAQLRFLQNADLRFEREQLVAIEVQVRDFADAEAAAVRLDSFKDELRRESVVAGVASSSHLPGEWEGWFTFVVPEGGDVEQPLRMRRAFMDHAFFETYDIALREGRFFAEDRPADRDDAVIINAAARRAFGWEEAVGKQLFFGPERAFTVVGVVEDYHYESLRTEVAPVLHFFRPPENGVHRYVSVRLHQGDAQAALGTLAAAWQRLDPTRPMPYTFAGDRFAQLYASEARLSAVAGAFTVLALVVACLGLFGLASLIAAQRLKEIGVRKVLGASLSEIVLLLSKDFTLLVLAAFVLAVPLGFFGLRAWLSDFAYHVDLHWGFFAVAGLAALLVASLTVGYQAFRAARANPVAALRCE